MIRKVLTAIEEVIDQIAERLSNKALAWLWMGVGVPLALALWAAIGWAANSTEGLLLMGAACLAIGSLGFAWVIGSVVIWVNRVTIWAWKELRRGPTEEELSARMRVRDGRLVAKKEERERR